MKLDQDQLNVSLKTQSNPFTWKGQFTPEFVGYILNQYTTPEMLIADPFSGSGTVLFESIKHNCGCLGFEINPSAYFMSKFYEYTSLTLQSRYDFITELNSILRPAISSISASMPLYIDAKEYRDAYKNLLILSGWMARNTHIFYWPFLLNILFLCEKDKKNSLKASFENNYDRIEKFFLSLPYTTQIIETFNKDARTIGAKFEDKVDFILTSPPYINVFNYHQNYRGIVETFNFNLLNVANSEIGSNRKHRSNRYKTVVQYAEDMGTVLLESARALKQGGRMVYVVGKVSNVRKTPFYNSKIIQDLVEIIPGINIEDLHFRQFRNRFGDIIQEDILTIKKETAIQPIESHKFSLIGMAHLSNALTYAPDENKTDIISILEGKEEIYKSPIY